MQGGLGAGGTWIREPGHRRTHPFQTRKDGYRVIRVVVYSGYGAARAVATISSPLPSEEPVNAASIFWRSALFAPGTAHARPAGPILNGVDTKSVCKTVAYLFR